MPSSALSLAGFMDLASAMAHFRHDCRFPDSSDAALAAVWNSARAKLGPPVANAGRPEISALPASADGHLRTAAGNPYLADWLERLQPFTFKLVETAPLITYQPIVALNDPGRYGGGLSPDAPLGQLLEVCIPAGEPKAELRLLRQENSFLIRSSATLAVGGFQGPGNKIGVEFALPVPFVHVAEYAGRCYLINGYHRAVILGRLGFTRLPCLFRSVDDWGKLGIRQGGAALGKPILEAANPPTVSHFLRGSAFEVTLRDRKRFVHVSWVEFTVEDE